MTTMLLTLCQDKIIVPVFVEIFSTGTEINKIIKNEVIENIYVHIKIRSTLKFKVHAGLR